MFGKLKLDHSKRLSAPSALSSPSNSSTGARHSDSASTSTIASEKLEKELTIASRRKLVRPSKATSSAQNDSLVTIVPMHEAVMICVKCSKRNATENCCQLACNTCCTAGYEELNESKDDYCPGHAKLRQQAAWRQAVLSGTTDIQKLANEKRIKRVLPGRYREPGLLYQGDSVVIWDLRAFLSQPKWREEAIRKSQRRRQHEPQLHPDCTRPRLLTRQQQVAIRKQRFLRVLEKKANEVAGTEPERK